ncbi:MAG TPA: phosphoribosylamine--glycine ligase [Rectinemataceae bacterium]|nr:phosphoribosylamine--glycine ligase [Rectinemataceae bacterium]
MKVLVVGSGGRESALALSLAQSPSVTRIIAAPGNPGIAEIAAIHPIPADAVEDLVSLAAAEAVDLVVAGPEAALAAGLADALAAKGIPCFGPSLAASRIESSKAFSKTFMQRHGIPTAHAKVFGDARQALAFAESMNDLPVLKASGLCAGKGVILPDSRGEMAVAIERLLAMGGRGGEILVEERLSGEEVSILAFSDGNDWTVMPAARDHKRLKDGDRGPNTGGMGSYAPALSMATAEELAEIVIAPAIRGLREEGIPFIGALFAGLILTKEGPKVLEYNCRFGDPETQSILPLLESDLGELLLACATGRLRETRARWREGFAASIVLAAEGYPEAPKSGGRIILPETTPSESWILHAGTRRVGDDLVASGGRVLDAVARGGTLDEALGRAARLIESVRLEGSHYRRDIGSRGPLDGAARASLAGGRSPSAYAQAGVDIDAGNRAVELMKGAVRSTYGKKVLAGIGSFGGMYDAGALKAMAHPVLVSSTDGVGTKTSLGLSLGRPAGLGEDMVNHSIDDILVQGARPLFFLDYVAASRLVPETVAEIVGGMAKACREAGCALIGGETAEMPGTYREGELDIAGTIVGILEREKALPRPNLAAGDLLVGLASSGLHTNGYSLARCAFAGVDLEALHPLLGESPADALLRPHRSYLPLLNAALDAEPSPVKALAHITGGGFVENIPRVLPSGLDAVIRRGSWKVPPIFELIGQLSGAGEEEMARVFNLGIGMVAVVAPGDLARFRELVPEEVFVIGSLEAGSGKTQLR